MRPSLAVLGSYFTLKESVVSVPTGSFVPLVNNNPNRYCLLFCAIDGKQINLARDPNNFPGGSLTLANAANASVQTFTFDFDTYGALVQAAWFGESGTGVAQLVGINEVLWMPPGSVE